MIPFAGQISTLYPAAQLESRRSFRHVLVLVKASALLHFRQRERDATGRVIADIADYANAERLAREPIGAAASGISTGARQYHGFLRDSFGFDEFTTTEAQRFGTGSKRTKYARLIELSNSGALEQVFAGRGRVPARWRLTGADPSCGEGYLPSPRSVVDSLGDCKLANEP